MTRQKLYFKVKEWKRFDLGKQEILTKRYEVILTDHMTRKEKAIDILHAIDVTEPRGKRNLDRGIGIVQKSITQFQKTMDSISGSKIFPEDKAKEKRIKDMFGSKNKKHIVIMLGVCLVFLLIPIESEARKNYEDIGISLDRTCLTLIKENMRTDCPTYGEILMLFPDTSNKIFSGDFIIKDGLLQREFPPIKNHLNYYSDKPPVLWVDPPADTMNKIKSVTIYKSLPLYEVTGSKQKANNTLIFGKDRYVNPNCSQAKISADKWPVLLGDTIQYLQSGCKKTNFESITKIYQKPTEHDITTSKWYQYKQWLKNALQQSKDQFLVMPDKAIYSPRATK